MSSCSLSGASGNLAVFGAAWGHRGRAPRVAPTGTCRGPYVQNRGEPVRLILCMEQVTVPVPQVSDKMQDSSDPSTTLAFGEGRSLNSQKGRKRMAVPWLHARTTPLAAR